VPGSRHFSLNANASGVRTFVQPDALVSANTGFTGYLELSMGTPNPGGVAQLNLVGSSDLLSLPLGGMTLCFRPFLPVFRAGVISCDGGVDLGVRTSQDHDIGKVGENGFTAAACTAAHGTVEGAMDPHPGVCNGPIRVFPSAEDSGAGAVLIAPDSRFSPATAGIPGVVSVQPGPCDMHVNPQPAVLGFVTGLYRVEILDADDTAGATLHHDERGQAFSCAQFTQENGPGRLVLGIGALHGASGLDVVTVFDLDD
jgi:hypothetical protein